MSNVTNKAPKGGKLFRGVMYFNMAAIVLLFILMDINWMKNREYYSSEGGGGVMAFFYIGPIVILNMIALLYFVVISLLSIHKGQDALAQYKKCAVVYGVQLLLSIIAILIVFI